MEPTDTPLEPDTHLPHIIRYVYFQTLTKLTENEYGWWACFNNEPITYFINNDKPDWKIGDMVKITMEVV